MSKKLASVFLMVLAALVFATVSSAARPHGAGTSAVHQNPIVEYGAQPNPIVEYGARAGVHPNPIVEYRVIKGVRSRAHRVYRVYRLAY